MSAIKRRSAGVMMPGRMAQKDRQTVIRRLRERIRRQVERQRDSGGEGANQ